MNEKTYDENLDWQKDVTSKSGSGVEEPLQEYFDRMKGRGEQAVVVEKPLDEADVTQLLLELKPTFLAMRGVIQINGTCYAALKKEKPGLNVVNFLEEYISSLEKVGDRRSVSDFLEIINLETFVSHLSSKRTLEVFFAYYGVNEDSSWFEVSNKIGIRQTYKSWADDKPNQSDVKAVMEQLQK